jgi:glycosyltransferase involved in cell wall biosynthesis
MKFVIHDYAGHPFQIQLSRQLAMRGHDVTHLYFADNPGPKGRFARPDDPPSLRFTGITLGHTVEQTALVKRRFNDIEYGRHTAQLIQQLQPDAVISGNTPTEAQSAILKMCKTENIRFVYWVQDFYSIAVSKLLAKKNKLAGFVIGGYYRWLDRAQLRLSDAVVVITEDFVPLATAWAGNPAKVSMIQNWAAIEDISVGSKDNPWSRSQGLNQGFTFLYSGTLGRKHNPELLLLLAEEFADDTIAVVAQGVAVKALAEAKTQRHMDWLKILPLQPAEQFPDVLATADILVATIESDAGAFAVPSKVLSYLCAGRPILLAAPRDNLAARIVLEAGAGIVVEPDDTVGFRTAAHVLRADQSLRKGFGRRGRAYAERTFDLTKITNQFETILIGERKSGYDAD